MILLINICKEKLHYLEFVKPLEDILRKNKIPLFVREYKKVSNVDIEKADKIIICGTSLKDNEFSKSENLRFFGWMLEDSFNKPLLGICGGMQAIGRVFSRGRAALLKKPEIGFYPETFKENFLGLEGNLEVFHLHNNYVDFFKSKEFKVVCSSIDLVPQAVKHKRKEIYGVLFHPEVRQKEMITAFAII